VDGVVHPTAGLLHAETAPLRLCEREGKGEARVSRALRATRARGDEESRETPARARGERVGSRAAAMRSRHRASVSPAFGRGVGVEPYRGSETYLGEQATLGQELGDVGGKHDVSVDGGRGGSEVSGDPISKGYAAGTLRDPEARARGKRAGEDVATRADRHARARTRVSRVSSTARELRSSRAANQTAHRGARENVAGGCARTCTRRRRRSTSRSTESAACFTVLEVSGRSCRTQWPRARRRHALAQTILSRSRFKVSAHDLECAVKPRSRRMGNYPDAEKNEGLEGEKRSER
jgi:hypothetical protein